MKSSTMMGITAIALVTSEATAFVMPAGVLNEGASLRTPMSSSTRNPPKRSMSDPALQRAGCTCISCSSRCFRGSIRSSTIHGESCRCGSCAKQRSTAVLMQAHGHGCGCGECSANGCPRAFHNGPCECPICAPPHGVACDCTSCANAVGGTRKREVSSLMVLGMGASAEQSELGEAAVALRHKLSEDPDSVAFEDTMSAIDDSFEYTPKRFVNGATANDAGVNEGSCKVFSFGKLAGLSAGETLACFGEHYRAVVADPSGGGHDNIRAFMKTGWGGIAFPDGLAMSRKGG